MRTHHKFLGATALLALTSAIPAMAQTSEPIKTAPAAEEDAPELIVTGVRGQPRTIADSSAPIDVLSNDQLTKMGGGLQMRDMLTQLIPSFQSQTIASSSWDSIARPAGLRGLGGAHVLVLVNSKRRHNSALINLATGNISSGSNPVDMDMIPDAAIERIEVLRDGAAAQYGSDAIAGVLNIILKDDSEGGELAISAGQRYMSDGETYNVDITKGFKLGDDGFLTLAVSARDQDKAIRSTPLSGNIYFLVNGQRDAREFTAERTGLFKGGLPKNQGIKISANAGYDVGDIHLYAANTFGYRKAEAGQAFRRPNSNQDVLAIYPDGFSPFYTLSEYDFQLLGGARGEVGGWNWDLSTTYGRDYVKNGSKDTLNASLGPSSPTKFYTYSAEFKQWTTNLDVNRDIEIGFAKPLSLAFGLEHRYENFVTVPRDPLAYANGFYRYPVGYGTLGNTFAAVGAQGAITLYPADATDIKRNVYAAYAEASTNVVEPWLVDLAVRYEHYDDSAGDVLSGKFSTRFEINKAIALRGTVSNGFRAPSLSQIGFAQTSTQIFSVNGVTQAIDSKTVKTDSAVGVALGASPLKPEKSFNLSAGFALTPARGLTVTVDGYQIKLNDRIMLTGFLSGTGVDRILAAAGFGSYFVRYFTNAIDTRTRGIDAVASYNTKLFDGASLRLSAAYNYNKTKITKIAANPSQLNGLGLTLFDRQVQGAIARNLPRSKLILSENISYHDFNLNLRQTHYGKFANIQTVATVDQFYGAEWVVDLDVSYTLNKTVTLSAGVNNLFSQYPDKTTLVNTTGGSAFAATSPFGFYGGYYYGRISVKF